MKKFKLLGIISILIIVTYLIGTFGDFSEGFSRGWNDADKIMNDSIADKPLKVTWATVHVKPIETAEWGNIENSQFNKEIPYHINSIRTYVEPGTWHNILQTLLLPWGIAFIYGLYCLIRFLIAVSKREIFTDRNVHRIRWFAYSYVGGELLMALIFWLKDKATIAQISLPGHEVISNALIEADWISMIVIILFTEIFSVGTKIKEEQDLTI